MKLRPIRPIHRVCALPGRLSPGGDVRVTASPPSPGSVCEQAHRILIKSGLPRS